LLCPFPPFHARPFFSFFPPPPQPYEARGLPLLRLSIFNPKTAADSSTNCVPTVLGRRLIFLFLHEPVLKETTGPSPLLHQRADLPSQTFRLFPPRDTWPLPCLVLFTPSWLFPPASGPLTPRAWTFGHPTFWKLFPPRTSRLVPFPLLQPKFSAFLFSSSERCPLFCFSPVIATPGPFSP